MELQGKGEDNTAPVREIVDAVYRSESRRVLATLVRLVGDFDRAEEAMHDAFAAAVEQWPQNGVPENPFAWLVSTGRFKAIDGIRRRTRFDALLTQFGHSLYEEAGVPPAELDEETIEDDRLRMIFTCCHPALPPDAQIALTLREMCGLTTEEIARAFITPAPTIAKRIVRAKRRFWKPAFPTKYFGGRSSRAIGDRDFTWSIWFSPKDTRHRRVILSTRPDLSGRSHPPGTAAGRDCGCSPKCRDFLAMMLFHESRRNARTSSEGELVLLGDQHRSLWDSALIDEGVALVKKAPRRASSVPIRCRPRSQPSMPRRRPRRKRIGHRSRDFTTNCCAAARRRLWN